MTYDSAWYHQRAQEISDIYWQELYRAPDEGGWIEWFVHMREGGKDHVWVRAEVQKSPEWAVVHAPRPSLPRLVNRNGFFGKETGEFFTAIECSDFNLYGSYLINGADVAEGIMRERSTYGFNMLRVWLAYWNTDTGQGLPGIGELNPAKFPHFYEGLVGFCELAAKHGLYIEFTAFTGPHIDGHWEGIATGLQGVTNAIVELTNENNAHAVCIDPNAYAAIPGILTSHGSNASQNPPIRPWWGYETLHYNDAFEWQRKTGHNTMEWTFGAEGIQASHVPAIANENTRPDRDGNLAHHYDAAAGAALLCAGSCFHSQSGKASFAFSPQDGEAAAHHVTGARSVPLEFQDGRYIREDPGQDLRVYSRQLADGRKHTVRIRK